MRDTVPSGLLAAIGLLSASALAYEILLTRIFAMVHWHHLVAIAISLALLGYGASGTFLALMGRLDRLNKLDMLKDYRNETKPLFKVPTANSR